VSTETRFTANSDSTEAPPVAEKLKVPKEYRRLRAEGAFALVSSLAVVFLSSNMLPLALLPALAGFALGRFIQSIRHEPPRLSGNSLMISLLSGWCLYNAGSMFWPLLFAGPLAATVGGAIFLSAAMGVLIGANARSIASLLKGKE
jgi:hypothetical protein